MFDPEYYVGAWRCGDGAWTTSKWREGEECIVPEQAQTVVWERRVFRLVPVPGEAAWARPSAPQQPGAEGAGGARGTDKRRRGDCEEPAESADEGVPHRPRASPSTEWKKARGEGTVGGECGGGCLAVSSSAGTPCFLKLYGCQASDVKLNEVLDCVCVLAVCSGSATFPGSAGGEEGGRDPQAAPPFAEEEEAHNPPHSAVPRLHALLLSRAPPPGVAAAPTPSAVEVAAAAPALRAQLLALLTRACCGDALAAEYAAMHLMSRVHARAEPLAVGALSLNLQLPRALSDGDAAAAAQCLAATLRALLPRWVSLPLSLSMLNAAPLVPVKDYGTNTLLSGRLQVANGTHILVDETALEAGRLDDTGCRNVGALKALITTQSVALDFQYYTVPLPTDAPVLILSRATSLLPSDCALPLRPLSAPAAPADQDAALPPLRAFLAAAKHLPHSIDPGVACQVEADLVRARAADATLGQEVFHRWLTLGRLLALSRGESSLTLECWRRVRELEQLAEERRRSVL